mmetsp:Transcript_17103/g.42431  ORF Transcript_17103/g.42431 Transcript_17103/m.42431 type:complete len:269 (-) Transcript_17103:1191-1997(-)
MGFARVVHLVVHAGAVQNRAMRVQDESRIRARPRRIPELQNLLVQRLQLAHTEREVAVLLHRALVVAVHVVIADLGCPLLCPHHVGLVQVVLVAACLPELALRGFAREPVRSLLEPVTEAVLNDVAQRVPEHRGPVGSRRNPLPTPLRLRLHALPVRLLRGEQREPVAREVHSVLRARYPPRVVPGTPLVPRPLVPEPRHAPRLPHVGEDREPVLPLLLLAGAALGPLRHGRELDFVVLHQQVVVRARLPVGGPVVLEPIVHVLRAVH